MAVSMKTTRSDFMISDAAMPQRVAELDKEQAAQMAQFAKILGGLDSSKTTGQSGQNDVLKDIQAALNDLRSDDRFEKALAALDKELKDGDTMQTAQTAQTAFGETSVGELPQDNTKLAEMVVKGELELDDIPEDRVTDELIQLIIKMMLELKLHGTLDEDDGAFNPAEAAVSEIERVKELDGRILSELYKIVEKQNEKEAEKKRYFEPLSEKSDAETLPSPATEEVHAEQQAQEGVFEEIIDSMTSEVSEDAEAQTDLPGIVPVEAVNVATQEQKITAAAKPVNEAAVEATSGSAVDVAQTVRFEGAEPEAAETVQTNERSNIEETVQTAEQTVIAETFRTASEGAEVVETVQPKNAELSAETAVVNSEQITAESKTEAVTAAQPTQSGDAQNRAGEDFGHAQREFEVKSADDFKSVFESVKTAQAQKAPEEPKTESISNPANRVKNAGEELEMLKNAKLVKSQSDLKPTQTANPLMSNQPVVFTRADGTKIEIKPAEVISQTMKIVERMIEETREQSEYSMILNPEELGRITVKLIKAADGAVSVTIAAENAHTQRILEQHSELMQNNLRDSGVNLASWQTVNESKQETYAQDYNGSSKNPYFRRDQAQNNDDDNEGGKSFADIIASM